MKKKLLAMLLVLSCVCVPVAGCGSDKKEASEDKKTEASADKEDKKAEDTEKEEKKEEEKKIVLERGTIEDGTYKNEAFGVSFPISEQMIVCTDEQIAQTLNLGQDLLEDGTKFTAENMEEAMEGAMYDTIILFSDNSSNMSVIYEDMEKSQGITINEDQYAKAVANMLSSMTTMNYTVGEVEKQNIGGTEFTAMTVSTDQFTQKYFIHKVDNYMIEFIFTYTDDTEQEVNDFIATISYEEPK